MAKVCDLDLALQPYTVALCRRVRAQKLREREGRLPGALWPVGFRMLGGLSSRLLLEDKGSFGGQAGRSGRNEAIARARPCPCHGALRVGLFAVS